MPGVGGMSFVLGAVVFYCKKISTGERRKMHALDNEKLMERFINGNEDAYGELYRRLHPWLVKVVILELRRVEMKGT
jgi:hypothetical protein